MGGGKNADQLEDMMQIKKLEHELMDKKKNNIEAQRKIYKTLLNLKQKEIDDATQSCFQKHMNKPGKLECTKDCLRQLQSEDPADKGIKCGCSSMPMPFTYIR